MNPRDSAKLPVWLAAGLIALAGALAYSNSFRAPFIFDAVECVLENPTIRQLWPLRAVLDPVNGGSTVEGRPLLNLSFALNYAWCGLDVRGYHAVNLAIHVFSALVLFGILRRTFALSGNRAWLRESPTATALVIALLWVAHPLQTESVTNIAQRCESLMAILYLLTLYLAIRGFIAARPRAWFLGSFAACLLGMAAKQVMVSAPLIVLLYDRTFIAGSFAAALRKRGAFYGALASTWLLLAFLVVRLGDHGGTVGFGLDWTWWEYLQTQFGAILLYLRLSFWPHPLILDYGNARIANPRDIILPAIAVAALFGGTLWALRLRPWLGFLGVWFFAILAPSSSVLPIVVQTIAEHRMYLPLAAVITIAVLAIGEVFSRLAVSGMVRGTIALVVVLALIRASFARNADYQSDLAMWTDNVRKRPQNPWSRIALADALAARGRTRDALKEFEEALRIQPDNPLAHDRMGIALEFAGRLPEAIEHHRRAIAIMPDGAVAHFHLAEALSRAGRWAEALESYDAVLRLQPRSVPGFIGRAAALSGLDRHEEAIATARAAAAAAPAVAEVHNALGVALFKSGRKSEAAAAFEQALALNRDFAAARANLESARSP